MQEIKRIELEKKVIEKLLCIARPGMAELVKHMIDKGFFISPASTKFHGNYKGGLMLHCTKLYTLFKKLSEFLKVELNEESMLICAYGHDLCKMGAYHKIKAGDSFYYKYNSEHEKGHAKLSIKILEKFIVLTEDEKSMILYHMGIYSSTEFGAWQSEYNIAKLVDNFSKQKLCKLFAYCDDLSSNFLEK